MAKKVQAIIKLQIQAGKANPAPPVGSALGQHGVNIMQFCKEYNERTSSQAGSVIPAEITVFEDRSFTFITKMPPAADLIKKALNLEKGSSDTGRSSAGVLTRKQLREIARRSGEAYRRRFIGRTLTVLWETRAGNGQWSGLTGNYIRVHAPSAEDMANTLCPARLCALRGGGMQGEL